MSSVYSNAHRLPLKMPDSQWLLLHDLTSGFKKGNGEKWPLMKTKKVLFHQDNSPCQRLMKPIAKIHELHFELVLYSLNVPVNFTYSQTFKKMLTSKRFESKEDVVVKTEAYFVAKNKSL